LSAIVISSRTVTVSEQWTVASEQWIGDWGLDNIKIKIELPNINVF